MKTKFVYELKSYFLYILLGTTICITSRFRSACELIFIFHSSWNLSCFSNKIRINEQFCKKQLWAFQNLLLLIYFTQKRNFNIDAIKSLFKSEMDILTRWRLTFASTFSAVGVINFWKAAISAIKIAIRKVTFIVANLVSNPLTRMKYCFYI